MMTNGRPPLPPVELGRSGQALLSDLAELGELQAKLLAADARTAANRSAGSLALVVVGAVLAASGLPVALLAAGYGLHAAGLPEWAAFLIAAVAGLAVGGLIAWLGWRGLKRACGTFRRSADAFSQNLEWVKASLSGGRRSDPRVASPDRPPPPMTTPPGAAPAPPDEPGEVGLIAPLISVPPQFGGNGDAAPIAAPVDTGSSTRTKALEVLAVLAVAYTLFFARAVLLPFTLALVLALLFRPVVRHLRKRWRLNEYAGAAGVLMGTLALLGFTLFLLAAPAEDFVRGIPEKLDAAAEKLEGERLFKMFQSVQEKLNGGGGLSLPTEGSTGEPGAAGGTVGGAAADLPEPAGDDPDYAAFGAAGPGVAEEVRAAGGVEAELVGEPAAVLVEERPPSLLNRVFSSAPEALGGFALAFVFLYFLLAEGDAILNNAIALLPTIAGKREAVGLTRAAEKGVSRYLMLVSAINAALGVCIGVAMALVGLPNPVLWGVTAALLNFIPYVGAFVGAGVVFLVAYLEPEFSLGEAALAPACYICINLLEGNFVTPAVLGKSISLNPLMVLLSLAFWGWIWGPTGAVLAVPLLSMTKIVCDDVESLRPLGLLLGPRLEGEATAAPSEPKEPAADPSEVAAATAA